MKKYDFLNYLQDVHGKEIGGTENDCLDDELADAFDNWLGELDQEMLIKYADLYAVTCEVNVIKLIRERLAIPV
jgi:hypothetical protein